MNQIRIWWASSRGKVIATLLVLWFGALVYRFEISRVWIPIVVLTSSIFFDLIVSYIRKRQWAFTLSTTVTGLLIGLIVDPTSGVGPPIVAAAIAAVSKQVFGLGDHRHVFNPAAIGILGASYIFGVPVAWWGASWGIAPVLIIAVGMAYVLWKLRRAWMTGVFLLVYFFITRSLTLTIDGTVFLFACIMLSEPVSSPSGKIWRYGWGALVGVLVAVQSYFPVFHLDPLLLALLGANLIGFFFIRRPWAGQTLLKR